MANSTTNLDTIETGQSGKEQTANALFDAASPATLFGRRATSTGLTWAYYGGPMLVDGASTMIANGSVSLTPSATNCVQATRAGVVSVSASFTVGNIPLYTVITGASSVTSYTDHRVQWTPVMTGRAVKAMADANQTLTNAETRCQILEFTGALTALRDAIVPLGVRQWTVFANTSGGFGVRVIGATGLGITIADGKRAIIYTDGTNVVRVTPDT